MVGGQCLDLEADKLGLPPRPDAAHVERLQLLKTGALIRCACEFGAILGQAGESERRALETYGQRLGLAFQIADDLLDVEGDSAAMGKAARKDAAKATLHAATDIDTAKQRLSALADEAVAALVPFGKRADILREAAAFAVRRER
jgi:farnesyl diphosphate synthase